MSYCNEINYWNLYGGATLAHFCFSRNLKDFVLTNGELYFWGNGGVLARPTSKVDAKMEVKRVHNIYCEDNDISMYRRLQRKWYYRPDMSKDAFELQRNRAKCQESLYVGESSFVQEAGYWRQSYLDFVQRRLLPLKLTDAMKIQRKSTRFLWKMVSYSKEVSIKLL